MSTIKLKRSSVQGKQPTTTDLDLGEVAINTYDGKMYIKKDDGAESIIEIGGGGTDQSAQYVTDYIYLDQFTGNGSNTQYTLSQPIGSDNSVFIAINGVHQYVNAYSVSSATLTFSEAPANGDLIEVRSFERVINGVEVDHIFVDSFTSDGTTNSYFLSHYASADEYTLIYINGVQQFTTEYGINAYELTFSEVPANGDIIEVRTFERNVAGSNQKLKETTHTLTTTANNQILDTFPLATYRSAKYMVQMSANSEHTFTEVSLLHDGTTVYLSEYGTINTSNTSLGTLDADISGSNVRLLLTPAQANTSVQTQRRILAV